MADGSRDRRAARDPTRPGISTQPRDPIQPGISTQPRDPTQPGISTPRPNLPASDPLELSDAGEVIGQPPSDKSAGRRRLVVILAYVAGWLALAVPVAYHAFVTAERDTVVAGHDATVSPTVDGYATIDLGAYLPNVRYPTGSRLGVDITVGKTNVDTYEVLLQRYALIGSNPGGEISKVSKLLQSMLWTSVFEGAMVGLLAPMAWQVVGSRRRSELAAALTRRRVTLIVGALAAALAVTLAAFTVWGAPKGIVSVAEDDWQPIETMVPTGQIPVQATRLQVQSGLVTSGTRRLIESAFNSYQVSTEFYQEIADRARQLRSSLRQPAPDETVALLVSDRHDNVGMDPVVRAIADAGSATVLFDAGDDTSTGEPWEAFSLDSLVDEFGDFEDVYVVPGNHDNGEFVPKYFDDAGFTVLTGEAVTSSDGIRLLGIADPRSSGLGSWRTPVGISFEDQARQLADTACAGDEAGERVSTLIVHDPNLGEPALERGCVDLLLSGHLHRQVGPDAVTGDNGDIGVAYTNGTTGGAAYAVALGTKLRRDAQVTLVTYRDGEPIGLQPVTIEVSGELEVAPFSRMPDTR